MRRYEWLLIAALVSSGLLCLLAVGGGVWGTSGPFMTLSRWVQEYMSYLMAGFALLWLWAVWGLVRGTGRRLERSCKHCGRQLESDWQVCPYCGKQ